MKYIYIFDVKEKVFEWTRVIIFLIEKSRNFVRLKMALSINYIILAFCLPPTDDLILLFWMPFQFTNWWQQSTVSIGIFNGYQMRHSAAPYAFHLYFVHNSFFFSFVFEFTQYFCFVCKCAWCGLRPFRNDLSHVKLPFKPEISRHWLRTFRSFFL